MERNFMGAGRPNYQALSDMGKLPKTARNQVPALAQIDSLQELLDQEKAKLELMYGFLTSEQKREYNMALKGEKPRTTKEDEE